MKIVTLLDEVVANVRSFNEGLETSEELRGLLSYFRAWYYWPALDMVAPSKYIGYKGINPETYPNTPLDGKETEPVLRKWFDMLNVTSPEGKHVSKKVFELTARYGKSMNRVARFGAPRGWQLSNQPASQQPPGATTTAKQPASHEIVEVFWRAYLTLYPEDQQEIFDRIMSQRIQPRRK